MSEFAEKCVQEMLPELNEMKKLGLFTDDELGKILKKRRAHEYKIRRKTKELKTYLDYIDYENLVLKLLKKRRNANKCAAMVKDIEVPIFKRIHTLYQLACSRFPGCVQLWLKHIDFCIQRKEKVRIGVLYTNALKIHPREENLWIRAAKYEMESNKSMKGARNILQTSLKMNPTSKKLYLEYFRMELLNAESARSERIALLLGKIETEANESVLSGAVALVVFQNAVQEMPGDVKFCMSFAEITRFFDFAQWIEDKIYEHLKEDPIYTYDEKAHASIACRGLIAMVTDLKNKKETMQVDTVLRHTYQGFKNAIETTQSEKMWELYLEKLMELLNTASLQNKAEITRNAQLICLEAADQGMMTESMAATWIELLKTEDQRDLSQKVAPMLVWKFPTNVFIWRSAFKLLTSSMDSNVDVILDLLKECNRYVTKGSDLVEIWTIVLRWLQARGQENLDKFFEISIETTNRDLTRAMKDEYLKWAAIAKPIKFIRKLFNRLSRDVPYSSNLIKIYLETEKSQVEIDAAIIRNTFEKAVVEFGESDVGLWLDYIKFESRQSQASAENIYYKAVKNLKPGLESEFIENYTLFRCGHV